MDNVDMDNVDMDNVDNGSAHPMKDPLKAPPTVPSRSRGGFCVFGRPVPSVALTVPRLAAKASNCFT